MQNDAEWQNCHKKYGEFLMYKKKIKNAHRIKIKGRACHQVQERLLNSIQFSSSIFYGVPKNNLGKVKLPCGG